MNEIWRFFDRREFLRRSAFLIPALHGSFAAPARGAAAEPTQARRPVEFLELELRCHRIKEQQLFYRDTLGLDTAFEGDTLVVQAGTTRLRFAPAETNTEPMYHFAFMIPENKLDRAIHWMKGRAPLQPRSDQGSVFHFKRWNAHSIYFFDPAGNLAEFIAHHELPTASSGDFSPRDILFACEIGLVAPELNGLLTQLDEHLALSPFFPVSAGFAPVGDRHGLFICVRENRIWLASDIPALTFPVAATLRGSADSLVEISQSPFRIQTVV